MPSIRRLLVVSHVVHYRHGGRLYAYGPYAREIDIWAELFPELVIAAPCRDAAPPGDGLPFTRANITIVPQWETGGETLRAKAWQLFVLPALVVSLVRQMWQADAIHVRCPGNLGLLGCVLAPMLSRRIVAKYAGQWNGFPGEARSVALQRAILASRWWRGPVTVYGEWPHQPPHVVSFFTSVLTAEQMRRAGAAVVDKTWGSPLRVAYVGRLSAAKNVHTVIDAVARLRDDSVHLACTIVGQGPQRATLEAQAAALGLTEAVTFTGGLDFERVLDVYEQADVLVLVSETEGWPKVIAEGMAFGAICVGSNRGLVPAMLGDGRGYVVEPGDAAMLAAVLRRVAVAPQEHDAMRQRAAVWAQRYSRDELRDALRSLLENRWDLVIDADLPSRGLPAKATQR